MPGSDVKRVLKRKKKRAFFLKMQCFWKGLPTTKVLSADLWILSEKLGCYIYISWSLYCALLYFFKLEAGRSDENQRHIYTDEFPEVVLKYPTFIFWLFLSCNLNRQRKDELEQRMSALQESRRELMVQLEGLMKLLKVSHLLSEMQCILLFPRSGMHYCCSEIPAFLSYHYKYFMRNRRNLQNVISILALCGGADG